MQLSIRSAAGIALAFSAFAFAQSANFKSDLWSGMRYRLIGPYRGGRVTAVTGVPSQPFTFYMGSTGGGVWKTTDAGHTWANVSDGFFAAASMGAVEVSQSNPDVVYAGTGSSKIRSNVSIGRGVYKSTDAGKTWSFIGLRDTGQISTIRVDPTNPDLVYVAALGNPFVPNKERGDLPLHGRRQDVEERAVCFRNRRRGRSRNSAGQSQGSVRLHVARPAQTVDHHQRRGGRRNL